MNDQTLQATALPRLNEPAPDFDALTDYTDWYFCKKDVAA